MTESRRPSLRRPSVDDFIFEGDDVPVLFRKRVIFSIAAAFVALVVAYVAASAAFGFSTTIDAAPLRERVDALGVWGPLLFIAVMAISVLFAPIPNAPIFVAAGLVWGSALGTVYSLAGLLVGSTMAFYVSRWTGRRFLVRLVGARAAQRLDHAADTMGGRVIFWSRMVPGVNFDWVSFVAGMTSISFHSFFVASALGMVLPTAVTVVAGDGLGSDFRLTAAAGGVYVAGLGLSALFFWERRRRWRNQHPRSLEGKDLGNTGAH